MAASYYAVFRYVVEDDKCNVLLMFLSTRRQGSTYPGLQIYYINNAGVYVSIVLRFRRLVMHAQDLLTCCCK